MSKLFKIVLDFQMAIPYFQPRSHELHLKRTKSKATSVKCQGLEPKHLNCRSKVLKVRLLQFAKTDSMKIDSKICRKSFDFKSEIK